MQRYVSAKECVYVNTNNSSFQRFCISGAGSSTENIKYHARAYRDLYEGACSVGPQVQRVVDSNLAAGHGAADHEAYALHVIHAWTQHAKEMTQNEIIIPHRNGLSVYDNQHLPGRSCFPHQKHTINSRYTRCSDRQPPTTTVRAYRRWRSAREACARTPRRGPRPARRSAAQTDAPDARRPSPGPLLKRAGNKTCL
jgi:hypothetical protein